jgi:cathepsin X
MTAYLLLVCAVSGLASVLLATAISVEHLHPHDADNAVDIDESNLPKAFDWRRVNGTNYCSAVSMQYSTPHCGSCWALATTGALSDRYIIATQGRLRIALSPQQLLNFNAK